MAQNIQYILITKDVAPYQYGGMANYYRGYIDGFGEDLIVFLPCNSSNDCSSHGDSSFNGVPAPFNKTTGVWHNYQMFRRVAKAVEGFPGETILLCGNFRPYMDVCQKLKKKFGCKIFTFFHGNDLLRVLKRIRKNFFKRVQYGRLFLSCDGFISNSYYTMGLIPEEYKQGRQKIIAYPGVKKSFLEMDLSPSVCDRGSFDFVLITVCRIEERKGIQSVIKAVSSLAEKGIRCRFDVIGKGDVTPYYQLAVDMGVQDQIVFHGYQTDERVQKLIAASDVFIMPSSISIEKCDVEGFGIVYLEAGALGKPVIASKTGGIPEAVEHGKTGLLVGSGIDTDELVDKIKFLYMNREVAEQMGRYAHDRVKEEYSYDVLGNRLWKTLDGRSCG